jgi:hypothetical protein
MDQNEPSERMRIFEEKIKPAAEALARACAENGMTLSGMVEVGGEDCVTVMTHEEQLTLSGFMVRQCIHHSPNIDGFMLALSKFVKENKIDVSASIVMRLLDNQPRH